MIAGAIVPHAPVLALGPPPDGLRTPVADLRAAVASLELGGGEALVVASPHGRTTGVYSEVSGSLDAFGVRRETVRAITDAAIVEQLAGLWGRPIITGPVDHGIAVSLLLSDRIGELPVVAVTFESVTGPGVPPQHESAIENARVLASAVKALSSEHRIAFVASAHGAAALSPRGPLLDRPEGHQLDARILDALRDDPSELATIEPDLWRAAGSCGAGPLTAFGELFARRRAELLAYQAPFGVGYMVARVVR